MNIILVGAKVVGLIPHVAEIIFSHIYSQNNNLTYLIFVCEHFTSNTLHYV